ncbi:MAG: hypothetical protein AB7F43_00485 [Bacteriovoracia bacterium]
MNMNLAHQKPTLQKVYQEIGQEEGLAQFLDEFYQRLSQDVLVGFFFDGKDLKKIARLQKEFLMRTWGISDSYTGKPIAHAHDAIAPILRGHFDRRLFILKEMLHKKGLNAQLIEAWVSFESRFRRLVQGDLNQPS